MIGIVATALLLLTQSGLSTVEVVFLDNYFGSTCSDPNLGAPFALGNACNKLGHDFSAEIACDATSQQATIELFFNSSTCQGTPDETIAGCKEGRHHEFSTGISCAAIPGDDVAFVTIGKDCNDTSNEVLDRQFTLLLILNECNPLPDFSNYENLAAQEDVPSGSFIITVSGETLTLSVFLDSEYEINANCSGTPTFTRVGKFDVCSVTTEGRLLESAVFGSAISFSTATPSSSAGSDAGAAVGATVGILGVVGAVAFVAYRRRSTSQHPKNQLTASTGNPMFATSGVTTQPVNFAQPANNQFAGQYSQQQQQYGEQQKRSSHHQYGQQYAPQFGYGAQ